jgi:hypothetical protein
VAADDIGPAQVPLGRGLFDGSVEGFGCGICQGIGIRNCFVVVPANAHGLVGSMVFATMGGNSNRHVLIADRGTLSLDAHRPLLLSQPHQFPDPALAATDDLGGRTRKDRPDGRSFLTLIVGLSTLASWPALDLQIEPAILSW